MFHKKAGFQVKLTRAPIFYFYFLKLTFYFEWASGARHLI